MTIVTGNNGNDTIYQDDYGYELEIYSYGGNDRIYLNLGGAYGGFNYVEAGDGDDQVYNVYEGGNDIELGTGNDFYRGSGFSTAGGDYYDIVYGDDGDDVFEVSTFHSDYYGENDNDTFYSVGFNNLLHGGSGIDVVSYELQDSDPDLAGFGIYADLAYEYATTIGTDYEEILVSIENLVGTGFADEIYGSSVANSLWGGGGGDYINGDAGNDRIYGEDGHDTLDGGIGADQMSGGQGNDVFIVDNAGDVVIETAGQGNDTIRASTSYTLKNNVSVETLETGNVAGNTVIHLTGNNDAQAINGNNAGNRLNGLAGNDKIYGNGGNDVINGGLNNDTLRGGKGDDTFVFSTALGAANIDGIADFTNAVGNNDRIHLDNAIFTQLGGNGALNADFFAANAGGTAVDANDYIIYETDTGRLLYDADGSGAGAAIQFATLVSTPTLTIGDLFVV